MWSPKVYFGEFLGDVPSTEWLRASLAIGANDSNTAGQRLGICRDSARETGKRRFPAVISGLTLQNLEDPLRNPNCNAVWEATWMWIVWFIGTGSWRRELTVWLPLVPKESAARGIASFPNWSMEAQRNNEYEDR